MRLEDLGLVGNCQFAALVERTGDVVWCCLPRFDSAPVFSRLLDAEEGGRFLVGPAGSELGTQRYLPNSNVLETLFETDDGAFRVVDLAPRFLQYDRFFRPTQLFRIIEPVRGTPRIRVQCEPRVGWTRRPPATIQGSNHLRFEGFAAPLRLTTDIPLTYLSGKPFTLTERRHLALTWGAPIEEPLAPLCDRFLNETVRYWQRWVKHCNVPPHYQEEVIRSALVLKLHCYEDTGAIVAALTTSIPEAPGSGRNWDYRYCWLRDSYYVLSALRLLGHFEERERFTTFLLDVCENHPSLDLAPLYRLDGNVDLDEQVLAEWRGYEGNVPVRVGNGAAKQRQNDVFGEMVLALAPIYLDERFREERSAGTMALLERLARKAIEVAGTPDAGIWEHRTPIAPRTFSSLMCWAAADRMAAVAARHRPEDLAEFRNAATRIREDILGRAWNDDLGAFASTYGGHDLDASLLQAAGLRMLPANDRRLASNVDTIWKGLAQDGWLLRYRSDDGFGRPEVAFVICTFWLVEALAITGRVDVARQVMEKARTTGSPLGLVAEDVSTKDLRLWGNFPQAYSHVGLIHAAFAASPRWSEVL